MFSFKITPTKLSAPSSVPPAPAPVFVLNPALMKALATMDDRAEQERKEAAKKRFGLLALVVGTGAVTFGGAYLLTKR